MLSSHLMNPPGLNVLNSKLTNQAVLGISNYNNQNLIHNKGFGLNTHGIFPKISNLRLGENSIPNSAHAQTNILMNNGGHISGMSSHKTHLN